MSSNKKVPLRILVALVLAAAVFFHFAQVAGLKWEIAHQKTIPHIDLANIQFESGNRFYASIRGFVVFENQNDQPKNLQQYYIIEPSAGGNYLLREVLVLPELPPKELDVLTLKTKQETTAQLILVDEAGNTFSISKSSKDVTILDTTGDRTQLITDNREYARYMQDFLAK